MTVVNTMPDFHDNAEWNAYEDTPKWLVWTAAMHFAAMRTESCATALVDGSALEALMKEVELHKNARSEALKDPEKIQGMFRAAIRAGVLSDSGFSDNYVGDFNYVGRDQFGDHVFRHKNTAREVFLSGSHGK